MSTDTGTGLPIAGLALLRVPFPAHQISKLPKPVDKDAKKGRCAECGGWHGLPAVHLDYVGHAALTDRLLDADPEWSWEPLAMDDHGLPRFDTQGGLWIRLAICGVTRLGYGNANPKSYGDAGMREKEVIGDALRNAAMRFGAALDLWHKGDLHGSDEDDNATVTVTSTEKLQGIMPPKEFQDWCALLGEATILADLQKAYSGAVLAARRYGDPQAESAFLSKKDTIKAIIGGKA